MLETKVVQVKNEPDTINSTNREKACFGWRVQNVQITNSQDSRTYTNGLDYLTGNLTVETTTLNYATITYQRDTNMSNHARIAELEREADWLEGKIYEVVAEIKELEQMDPAAINVVKWGLLGCFGIVIFPIGIIIMYIARKKYDRETKEKRAFKESQLREKGQQFNELCKQREAILKEAEGLL